MFDKTKFQIKGDAAISPFQNNDYVVPGEWALWVDHRPEVLAALGNPEIDGWKFEELISSGFRLEVKTKKDKRDRDITVLHAYPGGEGWCAVATYKWNRNDQYEGAVFTSTSSSRTGRHATTWCVFPDREGGIGSEEELARPEVNNLLT